jgi:hypothetical protein
MLFVSEGTERIELAVEGRLGTRKVEEEVDGGLCIELEEEEEGGGRRGWGWRCFCCWKFGERWLPDDCWENCEACWSENVEGGATREEAFVPAEVDEAAVGQDSTKGEETATGETAKTSSELASRELGVDVEAFSWTSRRTARWRPDEAESSEHEVSNDWRRRWGRWSTAGRFRHSAMMGNVTFEWLALRPAAKVEKREEDDKPSRASRTLTVLRAGADPLTRLNEAEEQWGVSASSWPAPIDARRRYNADSLEEVASMRDLLELDIPLLIPRSL